MASSSEEMTYDRRLAYLMQQSEVFAHFLSGEEPEEATTSTKKSKHRNRISEETEDKHLIKMAQTSSSVTRLTSQPALIVNGTMRPYQLEGLNWLVKLYDNNINGILADEMGLGKTLQVISLLAYLKMNHATAPHLVIVPKSTVSNWIREFNHWCPSLRVVKLLGDKAERAQICSELQRDEDSDTGYNFDVLVASYESCMKENRTIIKIKWSYLVIDEAHRIKNENSAFSKAARVYHSKCRLLVTGTPLQNNLHELWALLNFLMPDVFDSAEIFDSWFNTADAVGQENVVKKLHTVLRPFMLRRVKADVAKDLPPKTETKLYISLTPMQRQWYSQVLAKDVASINALGGPDKLRLLNVLMQLRKVCNHPYLFSGAEPGPPYIDGPHLYENSGKMILLNKLLPKLQRQGSRVLIFCQMTRMLDILEDYLLLQRYRYCRIDGNTSGDDRDAAMDAFNAPNSEYFCFILSTRAGGLGINLATADTVILFDSDFNPQVDLQAMDRAHRIGQTKPVQVFRFVTEGTVEEKIIERADRKLYLDAAVIQQGRLAEKFNTLSKGEILTMVRFGADAILNAKDGDYTDEDIDTLLQRGEKKTKEASAQLNTQMQHTLANFSVFEEGEINLFTFEGENYKGRKSVEGSVGIIALPQRERKRNYDVDEYFRAAEDTKDSSIFGRKNVRRNTAATVVLPPEHQFVDCERLRVILQKEIDLAQLKQQQIATIKELRAADMKARRKSMRMSSGGQADNANIDDIEKTEDGKRADVIEASIEAGNFELPAHLVAEKQALYDSGFTDWTKGDFRAYITALEAHGRDSLDQAFATIVSETGKELQEVERYHNVFWQKYTTLPDYEKYIERIEKGEKRIVRQKEIHDLLRRKIEQSQDAGSMTFQYGNSKNRYYSEESDVYLVHKMQEYGYGDTVSISAHIPTQNQFRFDWYMKSRTAVELQRRCDTLVRIVEKELDGKEEEPTVVTAGSKRKSDAFEGEEEDSAPVSVSGPKKRRKATTVDGEEDSRSASANKKKRKSVAK